MVTGVETAGLVLAAFPIAIECVKYYVEAASKMKEMCNHRAVLRQLAREVKAEMTIFKNSWNRLLQLPEENLKSAVTADGTSNVKAESLSHLDLDSVSSIVDICEDLLDILEELKHKFEKYERTTTGYSKMLHVTFTLTDEYRNGQLSRIHRLNDNLGKLVHGAHSQLSFNETHTKVVNAAKYYKRMREQAKAIHDALKEKLETSTCGCSRHSANLQLQMRDIGTPDKDNKDPESKSLALFKIIFAVASEREPRWRGLELEEIEDAGVDQQYQSQLQPRPGGEEASVIVIHGAMEAGASRHTGTVHSSFNAPFCSVTLEPPAKKQKVAAEGIIMSVSNSVRKGMKKSTPSTRRSSIRPGPSHRSRNPSPLPAPPKGRLSEVKQKSKGVSFELPTAESTDATNRTAITNHIISCLCSHIRRAEEIHCCLGIIVSRNVRRHRVWVPKKPRPIPNTGRAITLAKMLHDLEPGTAPVLEERLKLCVRLASSVLQLHDTEWLSKRWSKDEIWFIQEEPCRNPNLKYPLVRRVFQPGDEPTSVNPVEAMIGPCNISLFSLGITLIELWHWKSLEAKNIGEAWKYWSELKGNAPAGFSDAVRRCFGDLDHSEPQLNLDDFKNTVYSKIVLPLEDTIKLFCGKDNLAQIFEEYSA